MANIQRLLDQEAALSNRGRGDSLERKILIAEIKDARGDDPPPCWGEDDCSTDLLSTCPWRVDCGS